MFMHFNALCGCSKKVYWSKMHYSAPFTKTIKQMQFYYFFYFMLSSVKESHRNKSIQVKCMSVLLY